MAGRIITLIPKTTFDFTAGLRDGGTTSDIVIGDVLDVVEFTSIGIVVRVHGHSFTSLASMSVTVHGDGFLDNSGFSYLASPMMSSISLSAGTPTPSALFLQAEVIGVYAAVTVAGSATVSGETVRATISVDAYVRNPDPIETEDRAAQGQLPYSLSVPVGAGSGEPGRPFPPLHLPRGRATGRGIEAPPVRGHPPRQSDPSMLPGRKGKAPDRKPTVPPTSPPLRIPDKCRLGG